MGGLLQGKTAVLFDIDNTLLDYQKAATEGASKFWQRFTAELEEPLEAFVERWLALTEKYHAEYAHGRLSFDEQRRIRMCETFRRQLDDHTADEYFQHYLGCYQESWALFDDVLPCLGRLEVNYTLGIITNGHIDHQILKVQRFDLEERFAVFVTPEVAGVAKPHPQIFHKACQLLGVEPAHCIYVGDKHDVDAQAAVEAGLTGVWINRNNVIHHNHTSIRTIISLDELTHL
ncbi:MAG: HAD family hydrolase [Anaerolineales bacterium]|nr:HAD family hydrolase [Anaerolineales bacterium]